jgi:hypothetical protein
MICSRDHGAVKGLGWLTQRRKGRKGKDTKYQVI